jgi:hypothetical protein
MNREVQVRICEGLGVKLPGPTRRCELDLKSDELYRLALALRFLPSVVRGRSHLQFAVIIAMGTVVIVQMPVDQVIDVIPMRHRFVAAVCAVNVVLVMSGTLVRGCTFLRIGRTHFDGMIVDMIAVLEV